MRRSESQLPVLKLYKGLFFFLNASFFTDYILFHLLSDICCWKVWIKITPLLKCLVSLRFHKPIYKTLRNFYVHLKNNMVRTFAQACGTEQSEQAGIIRSKLASLASAFLRPLCGSDTSLLQSFYGNFSVEQMRSKLPWLNHQITLNS